MIEFIQEAPAQPVCMPLDQFIKNAASAYGEVPFIMGITETPGIMIMIVRNPKTNSWGLVSINTKKVACVVAAGDTLMTGDEVSGP